MSSFSPAFCNFESPFMPMRCRHHHCHGHDAVLAQHPPVKRQIKYIHSSSCPSARATGKKKHSQNCLPFRAYLFLNGFYVTPEFRCVPGYTGMGFRNNLLPTAWSAGQPAVVLLYSLRGDWQAAQGHLLCCHLQPPCWATLGWNCCIWGDRWHTGLGAFPWSHGNRHCLIFW